MNTQIKTISVIGLGYIGLPTAATFANKGFKVQGVDVSEKAVHTINQGDIHIEEVGLGEVVHQAVKNGNLTAGLEPQEADVHIIAVPTPIKADKSPDLSYVESATKALCSVLKNNDLVIVESTIPPRTCVDVIAPIIQKQLNMSAESDYHLVHCPERVIPGKILHEIVNNDRIVGGVTPEAAQIASELYASFVQGEILQTTATTAEMCKLMENTYRDVNIALANELNAITQDMDDVDILEAIQLANHHPRVNIHTPGIGVGGHCIPVDPWFIVDAAPDKAKLIHLARTINDARPLQVVARVQQYMQEHYSDKEKPTVACFGLSYKPDVDDMRESPAEEIVYHLATDKALELEIIVVEPHIKELPNRLKGLGNVRKLEETDALNQINAFIILVNHQSFHNLQNLHYNTINPLKLVDSK